MYAYRPLTFNNNKKNAVSNVVVAIFRLMPIYRALKDQFYFVIN